MKIESIRIYKKSLNLPMKSSLEKEFGSLPIDIKIYEEEDFKRSKEYAPIDRYISKKIPTSTPKKKRTPVAQPEDVVCFNVSHLRDDLYISDVTNIVLKQQGNKCYCVGLYDRKTEKILPLTKDKRKYCEQIELKILDL